MELGGWGFEVRRRVERREEGEKDGGVQEEWSGEDGGGWRERGERQRQ